jgi:hypothetical protein
MSDSMADNTNDSEAEKKRRRNERRRRRRAENPEVWEKEKRRKNERRRKLYAEDPKVRDQLKRVSRENYYKNADVISIKKLATSHGISVEQCTEMLARQNGICAICLKRSEKRLRFDHDHRTNRLRSLLCDKCNIGLGNYNDDSAAMRRGADYVDYWQWRHANPDNTGPPSFALAAPNRFLAPTHQTIQDLEPEGEVMTLANETTEDGKTGRLMRRAILRELHLPLDPDEPPPAYKLEAVARAIVNKASQGDMTAAKEILDRIDGRTPTAAAPASADIPNEVFFTWQRP